MKKLVLSVVMSAMLIGCSNPKDEVIPPDLNETSMQELAEKVKDLSEEDKTLLTGYIARSEMSKAFGGDSAPAGTTVGEAIENQKQWQAQMEEEERLKAEKAKKLKAEKDAKIAEFKQAVDATVFDKYITDSDWQSYINLDIEIANKSKKTIEGLKGSFNFKDKFGDNILNLGFTYESEEIPPGETATGTLQWDFNEYLDNHARFANLELSDMKYSFEPEQILFTDGTKLEMPSSE